MTNEEARGIINDYYLSESHTKDDKFLFVEAFHFLIDAYHNPNDMHNLAWFYAEEREFELFRKYLEMASEYEFYPSYESLGYLWYYGQTGTVDYEKAFYYFCKGAECPDDYLRIACEYKIADMYHYGYYVKKNEDEYERIIESLYEEISHPEKLTSIISMEYYPQPGIYYRLARIRAAEGRISEAICLLNDARLQLAEYLRRNPSWWGNYEEMESVVTLMHELSLETQEEYDLYDLFWLAKSECKLSFHYRGQQFTIECLEEDRNIVIKFNHKWYRDLKSFFEKAKIGSRPITAIYCDLIDYEYCYA